MTRSTKIGMILAAIGQSMLYTFGLVALMRMTAYLFSARLQSSTTGTLYLLTFVLINTISVTLCIKQINRTASLPSNPANES